MVTIVTLHSCCHCTGHETWDNCYHSMYQNPPLAWIIHISLMLSVTCHVSRAPYEVYTRSRHSAIPPQPSQRPGQLSKTSSNLIQFMCCGKIGNHKWKAGAVFKKQSYPGRCIVNDWEWKLQGGVASTGTGINYVSVWLDNADSVACGDTVTVTRDMSDNHR